MLLSLLKVLIIVIFLIKLPNLKLVTYYKILCSMIVATYRKYCFNFCSIQNSFFFFFFFFAIHKEVDRIWNIIQTFSTGRVTRNRETLRSVSDLLKLKKDLTNLTKCGQYYSGNIDEVNKRLEHIDRRAEGIKLDQRN